MRPDIAEIVWMMNKHCRATRELVVVEVVFQLREGKQAQGVAFHPAVIDGWAVGVKGRAIFATPMLGWLENELAMRNLLPSKPTD